MKKISSNKIKTLLKQIRFVAIPSAVSGEKSKLPIVLNGKIIGFVETYRITKLKNK